MGLTNNVIIPGGCLKNQKIELKCKAPDEKLPYFFSMANQLLPDEEILQVVGQPGGSSNVEITDYVKNVNTFNCMISGGRMGINVPIRFIMTTNRGSRYSFVCFLPIRQQGTLIKNDCDEIGVFDNSSPVGTIVVNSTTTLPPGQKANVTNVGTSTAAFLNFEIPQGDEGKAATIEIGKVTTGEPGSNAAVVNSGSSSNAILNFTLPTGKDGEVQTVKIGETKTLPAGHDATVEATTENNVVTLNFGIPSGTTGEAGQYILNIGEITTLAPDQQATATITSDGKGNHSLNLGIPQGKVGQQGNSISTLSFSKDKIVTTLSDGSTLETIPQGIYTLHGIVIAPDNIGELPDDLVLNGNIYTAPDAYLNGSKKLPEGLSLNSNIVMTDGSVYFPTTINNNGVLCAA
ncbi:hypothetical protein [Commensalibacter papalotli (ex Servin-Garciduenas et al. 2014)]|uniref:Uncharacterized protein n=1 Tax=Commensalibacter papalotli (ex Servin-Garciduenas et al. 2014) TaxID=1208583 RepID=W7E181_9PROT|nr:hypothetical protein [Commensalibacter papalotli (ex Servin-Garciduenas et al. 2014)]EUK18814.1 hypothetical protein COMX_03660 [Commensalibacter papalotli (ex Servin-Garciduenas et al. 2014)]